MQRRFIALSVLGLVFAVSTSAEPLLEGRVRLGSGEPVAAAQVRIFDLTDLRQGAIARAMTDGTGYFALPLATLAGSVFPESFTLGPNYPNPFNPSTIIPYQLAASSEVRLEVFNLLGQRIATLVDGERPAGFHTATWQATDAAGRAVGAGVYIYRMTVGVERQTGRMVLVDGQAGFSAAGVASVLSGVSGGGSDGAESQVYGLIVSGEGLAPYVDSSFRVEAGMAPVELVVSSGHSGGKAADDDCAFCDLLDALHDEEEGPGPSGKAQAALEAPPAPTNLRFEAVTDSSCRVRWDAAAGATDYDVNYKPAVGGKWTNKPHRGIRLYNTINDLEPDTEYRWAVRAENRDGASEWVFGPNFTTLEDKTLEEEEETPDTTEEGGGDALVTIPDANLRAAIATALGKARGAPVTVAEMKTLTILDASPYGEGDLADLTGLEYATQLTDLDLRNQSITDISALSGLVNLRVLQLGGGSNSITDLSPLAGLTNLEVLSLPHGMPDISALAGLTNLRQLVIQSLWQPPAHQLTDISALSGLTNLRVLWLGFNSITDISALSGLTRLIDLQLLENNITDISALSDLTNLRGLYLGDNNITDISALSGLTHLTHLELQINSITDISALSDLTNLTHLELQINSITDISALSDLTNLTHLELQTNNITDIPTLAGLTSLNGLWLGDNNITGISGLSGLTNLRVLWLGYNKITEVSALSDLTRLTDLDLLFNDITDISALSGLTHLTDLDLRGNPLSDSSIKDRIPAFKSDGVAVRFDTFREGDFDIELVFLDHVPEEQKRVLQYAARRWMSIITEDLPDYQFSAGWSGTCGDQSYEIPAGERIDDLRIYVTTFEGEHATSSTQWAWCGPHVLREAERLPGLACLGLNLKRAGDNLLTITLHEIGHGLGFLEWVWDEHGYAQYNSGTGENHFTGPLAIAAFNEAGGADYPGAGVRMWNNHWWPSLLDGELMVLWGTYKMALSAITVQSLADLGYGVDVSQANPYTLPGATGKASAKVAAAVPSIPDVDVTQLGIYAVLPGADPHWQGSIVEGLPLLPRDDRLRGRLENAEWIGGRGFDLRDDRLMGRLTRSPRAEPGLWCGAGLRREPIHVVDPQGRIIRTIGD